ncbi:hypothetical protein NQZ68_021182 [Dissostichus eleginoides]|nr:hypothetical protein NQZ68_021182 [Dissostichus eleginoides]
MYSWRDKEGWETSRGRALNRPDVTGAPEQWGSHQWRSGHRRKGGKERQERETGDSETDTRQEDKPR